MLVEQEEEILSHVAKVVRALITSAKPPVELRAILKDYVAIEGEQLPFRQLGYSNPQELLQDTEEFNFNGHGNQVNVMAQSIEMSRLSLSQLLHTSSCRQDSWRITAYRNCRRERLSPTHFNCFLSPTLLSLLSFSVFSHVRSFRVRELPVLAAKNSQKLADDVVICSTCSMHVHVHCTIVVGCPVQIPHK